MNTKSLIELLEKSYENPDGTMEGRIIQAKRCKEYNVEELQLEALARIADSIEMIEVYVKHLTKDAAKALTETLVNEATEMMSNAQLAMHNSIKGGE